MRIPPFPALLCLGFLAAACDAAASTAPGPSTAAAPAIPVDATDSPCSLAFHAILREAGSRATVGQVQFRVDPPQPGSAEASVDYRGVYGPAEGPVFGVLEVAIRSRVPDQAPTWSDRDKTDPGTTLSAASRFGRIAPMSVDMALALVDDASRFEAVVNVTGTTGGREAEGVLEPTTRVPESLRDRRRTCFGGG